MKQGTGFVAILQYMNESFVPDTMKYYFNWNKLSKNLEWGFS